MHYLILPYNDKEKQNKRWVMETTECKLVAHDISPEAAKQLIIELKEKA